MKDSKYTGSIGRRFRPKKCKACQQRFTPSRPLQEACTPRCAIDLVRIKDEKKRRQKDRERLRDLQPLSHWLQATQRVFNNYIRLRDKDKPCVSCGTTEALSWHAGHYRTTKAASQLRFNEDNCSKQCSRCNVHFSGNIEEYRKELVNRIGEERVQALENNKDLADYTPEKLAEIRKTYRRKINELNACS